MLSQLLGQIDISAALVMVAFFAATTVIVTVALNRQNAQDRERAYILQREDKANQRHMIDLQARNAHEQKIFELTARRDVQLASLKDNTIEHVDAIDPS